MSFPLVFSKFPIVKRKRSKTRLGYLIYWYQKSKHCPESQPAKSLSFNLAAEQFITLKRRVNPERESNFQSQVSQRKLGRQALSYLANTSFWQQLLQAITPIIMLSLRPEITYAQSASLLNMSHRAINDGTRQSTKYQVDKRQQNKDYMTL